MPASQAGRSFCRIAHLGAPSDKILTNRRAAGGRSSTAEHELPKLGVASSILVARSRNATGVRFQRTPVVCCAPRALKRAKDTPIPSRTTRFGAPCREAAVPPLDQNREGHAFTAPCSTARTLCRESAA